MGYLSHGYKEGYFPPNELSKVFEFSVGNRPCLLYIVVNLSELEPWECLTLVVRRSWGGSQPFDVLNVCIYPSDEVPEPTIGPMLIPADSSVEILVQPPRSVYIRIGYLAVLPDTRADTLTELRPA